MFAMTASFILSISLVPTMADYLLKEHSETHHKQSHYTFMLKMQKFQTSFENDFEVFREKYKNLLEFAINNRVKFIFIFTSLSLLASTLF